MAVILLAAGLYFARRSSADFAAYRNDFNVYYFAAREVLSGRDPYHNSLGPWTPYLYPPVLAELAAPLALLPVQIAAYIWFLISATSFVLAARRASILSLRTSRPGTTQDSSSDIFGGSAASRDWTFPSGSAACRAERLCLSGPADRSPAAMPPSSDAAQELRGGYKTNSGLEAVVALIALIVVGRLALDCFAMGQVNAIVASLAVAHVYLYVKGRLRLSACALSLAVAIKLTPVIFIVYHLAKGRIRFAIGTSLMLVFLLAASFLTFGRGAAGALRSFEQQTIANGQGFDLGYSGNQSIRAAESRLLSQSDESRRKPYDPASLVIGLVLMIGALLAARKHEPEVAAVAPIFCCMVFLSPLAWKSHFVTLILPLAYLAARAVKAAPGLNRRLAGCAIAAVFGLFTLTSPTLIGTRAADWADNHSLVLAGALITYLAVLFQPPKGESNADYADYAD